MIKFNNSNIIDWNFDDSNIIKVYHNGAIVYYKFDTEQGGQTPCFAVVADISQYSDTEFEDVFNQADEKWYKLNNLNQYEEYGIYGSGRTSCEGSTSRLPQGYTEVEYIEDSGSQYIDTGVYLDTSNFEVGCEVINSHCFWGYCHQNAANGTWLGIESTASHQTAFYGKFISSDINNISSYLSSVENTIVYTQSGVTVNGSVLSKSLTMGSDNIANKSLVFFGRYDFNINNIEWQTNSKFKSFYVKNNGTLVRGFVPAKRDSDGEYGMYDLVTNTFYTSPNGNSFSGGEPVTPTDCVTTYEGKLTIDDGYEYQYSGGSWVNVGEVSGSSRVPQGYAELEWAEVPQGYFSNFKVPYDFQTYYKYSIDFTPLDFYNSSYYGGIFGAPTVGDTNDLFFMKMDNGWGDEYYRLELHLHGYTLDTRDGFSDMSGKFAVFDGVRAKISLNLSGYTTGQGAEITVENEGMSTFTGVGTTTLGSYSPTYGVQNIYMFGTGNYDYGKTVSMKFHDFKVETSGGTAVYDYIPVKRQSDNAVGIYDIVNNTFNVPSDFTLIAGSAASGDTEYPIYYDTIQDPPNNVTFTSMTEAEEYECPWVGMKATIAGENYIFSGDSQSGYEWVNIALPYDAELQYLESSGSQYINTGVYLNASDFEIGYTIVGKKQLFGYCHQYDGSGTWLGAEQSAIMFWGTNENNENISSYLISGENTVIFSPTGATINGSDISKSLSMGYDSIASIPLLVFARYDFIDNIIEYRTDSYMKLKNFYVKNNGTLVLDLIPVRVGQVGYMYDRVSGQLFDNAGTGSFILGPDRTLPTGYTEVQYIENTDYASLEINYHPNQDTRVVTTMQAVETNQNLYGRFFGSGHWNCEDGTHGWQFDYEENPTGQLHISWGAECGWDTNNDVYGDYNVHTYDWNKNELYIDNTLVASATYQNFTCETNLGIFAQILGTGEPPSINGDGYKEYLRGKLYDFKIYDDGTLVADLVPCIDPNNVAGVYDIINNVFYTAVNQGYTFVAGPAVN